jgi:hypothetical protein
MDHVQVFRPERISRAGERNAWILAVAAWVLGWGAAWRFGASVRLLLTVAGLFTLAAAAISLGNWIDRKTVLLLTPEGVTFRNGLRNVTLTWEQILKVRVVPDRWGERVHVMGARAHFNFRMPGEIEFQEKFHERIGFANGDQILQTILKSSGLQQIAKDETGRDYARP